MIFSVLTGLVGGFLPARHAARQQVADALRQV
jgi:ABC-type antimicrobial peptide transport system permease subunit